MRNVPTPQADQAEETPDLNATLRYAVIKHSGAGLLLGLFGAKVEANLDIMLTST